MKNVKRCHVCGKKQTVAYRTPDGTAVYGFSCKCALRGLDPEASTSVQATFVVGYVKGSVKAGINPLPALRSQGRDCFWSNDERDLANVDDNRAVVVEILIPHSGIKSWFVVEYITD